MKRTMPVWALLLSAVLLGPTAQADTPANCMYDDIRGLWRFQESEPIGDRNIECDESTFSPNRELVVRLDFPDIASDQFGNKGHWTMIYNQGFEVVLNYRRYFTFSLFESRTNGTVSVCDETLPGWSHDLLGRNWACFKGHRVPKGGLLQSHKVEAGKRHLFETVDMKYFLGQQYVDRVNSVQSAWKATVYRDLQEKGVEELISMVGGRASALLRKAKPMKADEKLVQEAAQLPESFDWRDVDGVNYVSPVRNQGQCGSCYSFASLAMIEARVRIATNNTRQPVFSPQDILDCSEYSQDCSGGFSYLIAGKYAQDFGLIEEKCNPYRARKGKCVRLARNETSHDCLRRTYVYDYKYVGGFYGAGSEEAMLVELVRNGPVAVGIMVYQDFMSYKRGVYHHTEHRLSNGLTDFTPFEETSHAVLVVGYGVDGQSGDKYWIVKNSWGPQWGQQGYIWIRRGTDECGIESMPVAATVMP